LVIEMANDQVPVSEFGQPMKQRHRVSAARYADEVAAGGRKMGGDVRVENELPGRLHIVQQATSAESRQDIKERRFAIAVF
jgi:hypothetical protein